MKKIFLLFFALLFTSRVNSQIFIENFEYPPNTEIATTPLWYAASDSGNNPITVTVPGLTFPDYIGSGVGNTGYISGGTSAGGEDDSASLVPSVSSGTVYSSFMIRLLSTTGFENFCYCLQGSNNENYGLVYIKRLFPGYQIGVQKVPGDAVVYYSPQLNLFQTYLVIVKYEFKTGSGDDDEVSLFVYDANTAVPSVEPAPSVGPLTSVSPDAPDLSRVFLNKPAGGADIYIDGIYVDLSWNNSVLPVELASFTSHVNKNNVTLNWSTSSENNNSVFEIERSAGENNWIKAGMVSGKGTTASLSHYSFNDNGLLSGNYSYRLKQIDFNGNFEYFNLNNEVNIGTPSGYALSQNFPNPFNPSTTINFDIPRDGNVSLKVFDLSGKEVGAIVNETMAAGYHSVRYDGSSLSSGIYFYTLKADNFTATKKLVLLK